MFFSFFPFLPFFASFLPSLFYFMRSFSLQADTCAQRTWWTPFSAFGLPLSSVGCWMQMWKPARWERSTGPRPPAPTKPDLNGRTTDHSQHPMRPASSSDACIVLLQPTPSSARWIEAARRRLKRSLGLEICSSRTQKRVEMKKGRKETTNMTV